MEQEIQLNAHNKQEYPPMHTCEHIINRTMDWHRHDCHSYRYHQLGLHEHADRKKAKRKKQFINVIYGTRNPT